MGGLVGAGAGSAIPVVGTLSGWKAEAIAASGEVLEESTQQTVSIANRELSGKST